MGVKDLWNILSPSCEKKSLWELQGLTIAIDLSSWIVDSQNVGDNSLMNMYLRNLFFRTSYLLLLGVKPIFVLDGRAPTLKHSTIARRQQQVGKDNQEQSKTKNGNRGRLNCFQKKCEELLLSLGVRCYKSEGEAEALCSRLNELGVVDAVISQDSDCFLYGANTVLRNFTMSPAYTCDMYRMESIKSKLGLSRNHLLAFSLLCGCDYEAGVQGVGKQSAVKFLTMLADDEVLQRLRSWRDDSHYNSQNINSQMTPEQKLEHSIRKKALLDPNFPSEEVISEFLSAKDVAVSSFVWEKPSLPKFMVIADRKLAWEEDYTQSKFLPLLTRWQLNGGSAAGDLSASAVVKKRVVRGVPSYEVQWQHQEIGEFTTVEPISLFAKTYAELHQAFVKSKEKPRKEPRGRKKKSKQENDLENVENLLGKININCESTLKQPIKKRSKQKETKGLQTLDKYLSKEVSENEFRKKLPNPSLPVFSHSTPIMERRENKSYHYLSDDDTIKSPLRKNKILNKTSVSQENISSDTIPLTPTHRTTDFLSFLDSRADSDVTIDLSDVVNSIVSRGSCNPAVQIWANKFK